MFSKIAVGAIGSFIVILLTVIVDLIKTGSDRSYEYQKATSRQMQDIAIDVNTLKAEKGHG